MKHILGRLYNQIIQLLPIVCVDLLVVDATKKILMLKRKNPPANGEWWFPGGRVYHGELRKDAALRKLNEECGLKALSIKELGTFDLIFDVVPSNYASHGVTTVFNVSVEKRQLVIDDQSIEYAWKLPAKWLSEVQHEFLIENLSNLI